MQLPSIPEDLVNQIAADNCLVFIGAGLSMGAGLPGWPSLLRKIAAWAEQNGVDLSDREELEELIQAGDLLTVAEELSERLGKENLRRFMIGIFGRQGLKPTQAHRLLTTIPFAMALTSNYDRLLETAYTIATGETPHVFTHDDVPELSAALRNQEFYLLKVHGTIDRTETLILAIGDYREVIYARPAYKQHLTTLFSTHTCLFLGFSLSDPDLDGILQELRTTFKDYTGTHYALMNTQQVSPIKRRRFSRDYGIQILPYAPSASNHPEVPAFLQALADQVAQAKAGAALAVEQPRAPLDELASEVRMLLQAIHYQVEVPTQHDERSIEMFAVLEEGAVRQRVLVRCIGGEIQASDVETLDRDLDRATPQGWLISDKRVSGRARTQAAGDLGMQIFTLAEFLRTKVWGPYVDRLQDLVEGDRIPELYVDLECHRREVDDEGRVVGHDRYESLDAYIDGWLVERGKVHISVLGKFGTGKTWFCRHYAYRQLLRFLDDPANERLPLLITLRAFSKTMSAPQLVNDALLEQYRLPFLGSAHDIVDQLNRQGKLLLILDGFDEMARQVDYQTVVDNFWELASLAVEGSKIILTSRTEYFRWAKESEKILGGSEYGRNTIVLKSPKFEAVHLEPFTPKQIREVIVRRLGSEAGPPVAERILGLPNLSEMARKPVLVELLLAALDEVSADVLENPAQVYLYATNRLLLRNIDTERTFTSTADKLFFLCELAWEMIQSGELRIHFARIPDRIQAYFGDRIQDPHELDNWDWDLRSQTLLHRDAAGYYEFAHKSLAEYFVALKFAAELGCLGLAFRTTYRDIGDVVSNIPFSQKGVFELAITFGAISIVEERMHTVRTLLLEMLADDRPLWSVLYSTRGLTAARTGFVGGNAATLLGKRHAKFTGQDLSNTVLDHADLSLIDLSSTNLMDASLRSAVLSGATLENTDLRNSDLDEVELQEPNTVVALAWSSDESQLAISLSSGGKGPEQLNVYGQNGGHLWTGNPEQSIFDLCWSPDGKYLAGLSYYQIMIWDIANPDACEIVPINRSLLTGVFWGRHSDLRLGYRLSLGRISFDRASLLQEPTNTARAIDLLCYLVGIRIRRLVLHTEAEFAARLKLLLEENRWQELHKALDTLESDIVDTDFSGWSLDILKEMVRQLYYVSSGRTSQPLSFEAAGSRTIYYGDEFIVIRVSQDDLYPPELGMVEHMPLYPYSVAVSPSGRHLAMGSYEPTVWLYDIDSTSSEFGQNSQVFDVRMNCSGALISGARGLSETVRDFLVERGAIQ